MGVFFRAFWEGDFSNEELFWRRGDREADFLLFRLDGGELLLESRATFRERDFESWDIFLELFLTGDREVESRDIFRVDFLAGDFDVESRDNFRFDFRTGDFDMESRENLRDDFL